MKSSWKTEIKAQIWYAESQGFQKRLEKAEPGVHKAILELVHDTHVARYYTKAREDLEQQCRKLISELDFDTYVHATMEKKIKLGIIDVDSEEARAHRKEKARELPGMLGYICGLIPKGLPKNADEVADRLIKALVDFGKFLEDARSDMKDPRRRSNRHLGSLAPKQNQDNITMKCIDELRQVLSTSGSESPSQHNDDSWAEVMKAAVASESRLSLLSYIHACYSPDAGKEYLEMTIDRSDKRSKLSTMEYHAMLCKQETEGMSDHVLAEHYRKERENLEHQLGNLSVFKEVDFENCSHVRRDNQRDHLGLGKLEKGGGSSGRKRKIDNIVS